MNQIMETGGGGIIFGLSGCIGYMPMSQMMHHAAQMSFQNPMPMTWGQQNTGVCTPEYWLGLVEDLVLKQARLEIEFEKHQFNKGIEMLVSGRAPQTAAEASALLLAEQATGRLQKSPTPAFDFMHYLAEKNIRENEIFMAGVAAGIAEGIARNTAKLFPMPEQHSDFPIGIKESKDYFGFEPPRGFNTEKKAFEYLTFKSQEPDLHPDFPIGMGEIKNNFGFEPEPMIFSKESEGYEYAEMQEQSPLMVAAFGNTNFSALRYNANPARQAEVQTEAQNKGNGLLNFISKGLRLYKDGEPCFK